MISKSTKPRHPTHSTNRRFYRAFSKSGFILQIVLFRNLVAIWIPAAVIRDYVSTWASCGVLSPGPSFPRCVVSRTVIPQVCCVPDRLFPGVLCPGPSFPRCVVSRTVIPQVCCVPDRHFPGVLCPGPSFPRCVVSRTVIPQVCCVPDRHSPDVLCPGPSFPRCVVSCVPDRHFPVELL